MALLASALLLGPALAHAFELPNKIGLPREEYFIVQKAYRGWNLFAWLLAVQVLALLAAAISARPERRVLVFTLLALACVAAAQGVFWTFASPPTSPRRTGPSRRTTGPGCAWDGKSRMPPVLPCRCWAPACFSSPSSTAAGAT